MKVFISWSGDAERRVAEALRDALRTVTAGEVEAFVSSQDIPLGERGIAQIETHLSSTDYGIVVLSAGNKDKPWINYEGGALATLLNRRVAVVLMDLSPADVDTPLKPFQSTRFSDRAAMLRLFTEIAQYSRATFPAETVETVFESVWPKVEASWVPSSDTPHPPRSQHNMLEELVEGMRRLSTGQGIIGSRLEKVLDGTRAPVSLHEPSRATAGKQTLEIYKVLQGALRKSLDGRVTVRSVEVAEKGGWDVTVNGASDASRADFDRARELARALLPLNQRIVVHAPLEPVDLEQGRMPWETLTDVVPIIEDDRDLLDP